jgi:hypothetical protein
VNDVGGYGEVCSLEELGEAIEPREIPLLPQFMVKSIENAVKAYERRGNELDERERKVMKFILALMSSSLFSFGAECRNQGYFDRLSFEFGQLISEAKNIGEYFKSDGKKKVGDLVLFLGSLLTKECAVQNPRTAEYLSSGTTLYILQSNCEGGKSSILDAYRCSYYDDLSEGIYRSYFIAIRDFAAYLVAGGKKEGYERACKELSTEIAEILNSYFQPQPLWEGGE